MSLKKLLAVGAAAFIVWAVVNKSDKKDAATSSPSTSPAQVAAAVPPIPIPEQQAAFVSAIEKYRSAYASAENDMAKGAQRQARADELCAVLKNKSVKGWIGKITTLSSNGDGLGILAIEVAEDVEVKTWNNGLSDISDNTLLKASSPVFKAASSMKVGQTVEFSGNFFPSRSDCIEEPSLTQSGSMQSPEFIMRFSSLKAAS